MNRILTGAAGATLTVAFLVALITRLAISLSAADPSAPGNETSATQILDITGVKGGLIVHIGCGDGKLTAAMRANDSYFVHGLDADMKNVEAARKNIKALGLYGPVAVEQYTGARLPYSDNLINLVVSGNPGAIPMAEVMRALAPNGVAYIKTGGEWTKTIKPRPKEIDEWTHYLHDAGNNAVANDTVVGPPRSLQWMAAPLWLRSHETPSGVQAMVCGGGRLFYILDEGLIGITDQRMPERWALLCRDAFNGKLLWRRTLGPWGWPQWAKDKFEGKDWTTIASGRTAVPEENQRRLVADGDRLYATLSYGAPLTILDAATGKELATLPETAPVRQIVAADGVALVYSQAPGAGAGPATRRANAPGGANGHLIAVKGSSSAVMWRKEIAPIRGLSLAIDKGRLVFQSGKMLVCLDLQTNKELWQAEAPIANPKTLIAHDSVVLLLTQTDLAAHDGATGKPLWQKKVLPAIGLGSEDLFVINGVVWPGMSCADEKQNPMKKGDSALAIGYDLRTGEERKRVFALNLISPEHHHRCYRNKATARYLIASMEGEEFLDLQGTNHCQNNFVRGACRLGIMPCNGMLYSPADQCFCEPGAKLLGFKAIGPAPAMPLIPTPDDQRLERGPAYGKISDLRSQISNPKSEISNPADWPTYRYNAARHGATPAAVGSAVQDSWRVKMGGPLTAPVAAGARVYVASRDAHTIHSLELSNGKLIWDFVAGGRIDSPPTLYQGMVLVGSADGWVYCLRADDGALAWRFLAAPCDRRIASFDQIESVWPVHGSLLVRDGIAYVAAGRSTYLDGGIRLYALDPKTGAYLHKGLLSGPFPDGKDFIRDVSFFIQGANSDVLASEGNAIFMRQKRLTPSLQEEKPPILSSKGESDVGMHVFSTAGLLDDSWYNRTFWMYSKRWPGFQLANQAPKSGQLLVVDEQNTYGVKVFYRRNLHTTMFFPGKEGYLLFADKNTNEPQIVGEPGARPPVAWLPQSDYMSSRGLRTLGSDAFGLDKMIGYTRAEPPLWTLWLPVRIRSMVKAADTIFAAGAPDVFDDKDPYAAFEGRKGAKLVVVSAKDGKKLSERPLDAPPIFDGLIAVEGNLIVALEDGSLVCMTGQNQPGRLTADAAR